MSFTNQICIKISIYVNLNPLQQFGFIKMSLKMNIEIAVHIGQIMLRQLQRVGWVQYRMSISYLVQDFKQPIFFMVSNISFQPKKEPSWIQPSIANDSHYCYSTKHKIQYANEPIEDGCTFFFKSYIDLALIDKIKLKLTADVLFSEEYSSSFEIIHSYKANIKKIYNIFSYLPASFDQLGILKLQGLYHASLMELKFQPSQYDQHFLKKQYKSMQDYLQSYTLGYKLVEVINFCKYYRQTMENEFAALQERYSQMVKTKDREFDKFKFHKLNKNKKIECLLNELYQQNTLATSTQKQSLIQLILQDILSIKALIYQQWNNINGFISQHSAELITKYRTRYEYQLKERLKNNIFSCRIKNHDWTFSKYHDNSKNHKQQAEIVRKKSEVEIQLWQQTFLIEGDNQFEDQAKSIKIFQQIYETGNLTPPSIVSKQCQHVVILVHGFQAHRNDLILLKQCLQARHQLKVYISASNIGKTQESIDCCGKRLAIEVNKLTEILKSNFKISFIGHSMGGIIVRSALKYLVHMKEHFHAYVSICTPHLGYLYSTTKLVHAGLWLINTLQKCDSILQLCLQDHKNLRECLLYKLTQGGLLNNFKKVSFIASSQDEYVAYESARVQKNAVILTQDLKNSQESSVICEMIDNMLCEVEAFEISRLDVIFSIEQNNVDSFLGRTGHIKFLNDPHFIKQFAINLQHLFL